MRRTLRGLVLLAPIWLSGCLDTSDLAPASPVLASVNGVEITHHQFDRALARTGISAPSAAVREEITAKLIDRELALQRALEHKLDRQPDIMLKLEEARRDILAAAWADRVAADAATISREDAARYYREHPALFEARSIYQLHEVTIAAGTPGLDGVKQQLVAQVELSALVAWMHEQGMAFNEQRVIRAAEQLPIEALPRLAALEQGERLILESPRGVIVYGVLGIQPSPLTWEVAQHRIRDYLIKRTGRSAVEREMKRLRRDARIERPQTAVASAERTP